MSFSLHLSPGYRRILYSGAVEQVVVSLFSGQMQHGGVGHGQLFLFLGAARESSRLRGLVAGSVCEQKGFSIRPVEDEQR